ncbi:hypothetical protein DAMA08_018180 [Martiniozyma asiatica (nom. inval.)]|nr:hypothetical protein DAMA08_018180 [Martiniozyma asiatica]
MKQIKAELYFLLDNEKKYNTHDEPLQNEKFEEDEKKCFTVALEVFKIVEKMEYSLEIFVAILRVIIEISLSFSSILPKFEF